MSANEQQGADINFDGFTSFSQVFRSAFTKEDDAGGNNVKSYEEILEEYERFFSLDE
jgi:DnaJ-class molecular chaperone